MIVLVGFMGAGKTTVGHLLSGRLGLPFTDSDEVIEQRAGRPVRQIFAEDGEPAFRALEHHVIAGLLDGPALVLALGGGAAEHPGTRALLARGDDPPRPPRGLATAQVVYLEVSYDQAMARVGGDQGRPLLARPDLAATYRRRLPLYAGLATLTVPTDGRTPEAVTDDILAVAAPLLLSDRTDRGCPHPGRLIACG
jgi:shikimate kinase